MGEREVQMKGSAHGAAVVQEPSVGSAVSVKRKGSGAAVLFVHGSVHGPETWAKQRSLATEWTTLILERRGFGESPPSEGDDFEVDAGDIADALGDGAHLVGHSYGGVGALLAAAARPQAVRSLTLVEPVAYSIAIEHPAVQHAVVEIIKHYTTGPKEPAAFLEGFLGLMGAGTGLPPRLPPPLEHATRLLMNARPPFVARIRLDEMSRLDIPTLVISGGHSEVFEAICDKLEEAMRAERLVVPGAGHAVPSVGDRFNEALERFLRTSAAARG